MSEPLKLRTDPKQALAQIGSYCKSVRNGRDRAHYEKTGPEGSGREIVGYWQTGDWIEGLLQLAEDAERIGNSE